MILKLEQLQLGGSFKVRGALNKLLRAPRGSLSAGVVTASGGNHGVGVALAAAHLGVRGERYIPVRAPESRPQRRIEQALGARCEPASARCGTRPGLRQATSTRATAAPCSCIPSKMPT